MLWMGTRVLGEFMMSESANPDSQRDPEGALQLSHRAMNLCWSWVQSQHFTSLGCFRATVQLFFVKTGGLGGGCNIQTWQTWVKSDVRGRRAAAEVPVCSTDPGKVWGHLLHRQGAEKVRTHTQLSSTKGRRSRGELLLVLLVKWVWPGWSAAPHPSVSIIIWD